MLRINSGSSQKVWYVRSPLLLRGADSTDFVKFDIASEPGYSFYADQLREPTGRVCCGDEIIPDPDSIPLTVLNHPRGKMLEINFAAYDPPEPSDLSMEGGHPVLVLRLGPSFEILTREQAWGILWIPVPERDNRVPHGKVRL